MTNLPENFEKEYMALVADFSSDDTKKLRRNLVVSSFIILSVSFLDLSLSDVKAFGLNLSGGDSGKIYIVALIMIVFWLVLFFINHVKDHESFKEKNHNLNKPVYLLADEIKALKEQCEVNEKTGNTGSNAHTAYDNGKNQFKIHQDQLARLDKASKLQNIINSVNFALPALLSLVTVFILIKGLLC